MGIISEDELQTYMDEIHKGNDSTYQDKTLNKGFITKGFISESFGFVEILVTDELRYDSEIIHLSDSELLEECEKFTGDAITEYDIEFWKKKIDYCDKRGFVSNGWYLLKRLDDYRWNGYTTRRDLAEIKRAILKAGKEQYRNKETVK